MADLLASGRLIDAILLLVLVEAVVLVPLGRRAGLSAAGILANLAAGAFLLLALRSVLAAADWTVTAMALAAAGLAHLADVALRLRA